MLLMRDYVSLILLAFLSLAFSLSESLHPKMNIKNMIYKNFEKLNIILFNEQNLCVFD